MSRPSISSFVLASLVALACVPVLARPAAASSPSYRGPVHGHSISWAPEWSPTTISSDFTSDRLTVTNGVSTATFRATFGFGGDEESCSYDISYDFFESSPYQVLPDYPATLLTVPLDGDRGAVAPGMYLLRESTIGEDFVGYVDCRSLSDEAVLISVALVPADEWDSQLDTLRALWESVTLPDRPLAGKVGDGSMTPLTAVTVWFAADLDGYWAAAFEDLGETYRGPAYTVVQGTQMSDCGEVWPGVVAFYCPLGPGIYMDDRWLSTYVLPEYGVAGIVAILAHEVGHAVQFQLDEISTSRRGELQADCLAGAYMATTVERGIFDPADIEGLAGLFREFGDDTVPGFWDEGGYEESHGTGQQRSTLFRRGMLAGVGACGLGTG